MFDSSDNTLTKVITNLFDTSILIIMPKQRQSSVPNNFHVLAIAVCIAILLKENPNKIIFNEDAINYDLCK